jgi:hypothetical protein
LHLTFDEAGSKNAPHRALHLLVPLAQVLAVAAPEHQCHGLLTKKLTPFQIERGPPQV